MKVAYQKGLEQMAESLIRLGYDIVSWEDATHVDALLYSEPTNGMLYSYTPPATDTGMLLINVNGRTVDDVVYMLDRRGLFAVVLRVNVQLSRLISARIRAIFSWLSNN